MTSGQKRFDTTVIENPGNEAETLLGLHSTNRWNTTFYIGMTNDIQRRMHEHKAGIAQGFSKQYNLHKLIHLEEFSDVNDAITREKQLKNWRRSWKEDLVRKTNPNFEDLFRNEQS